MGVGRISSPVFVGRRPELAALGAVLARAGNGDGSAVLVEGEAGIGKSRLMARLLRVAGLSAATRSVLSAAAAIGRSVDHRLLASVAGGSERDLLASLREATEHHVLVATAGSYRFRHALLREAIYEDTLPGERLRLHRLAAET
jgi:predicted ATPase